MHRLLIVLCLLDLVVHAPAPAAQPVDGSLVVAIDGSGSLQDDGGGWDNAFQEEFTSTIVALVSEDVTHAIAGGYHGCIGLTIFTWSSADPRRNHGHPLFPTTGNQRHRTVLPWKRWCAGDANIRTTLEMIALSSNEFYIGGSTSISAALFDAGALCDNAPFKAARCVIDISADQSDNDQLPGMNVLTVRANLYARKYRVNGLPLVSPSDPTLEEYFLDSVVTPDGFVHAVSRGASEDGILKALTRKFALEIAQLW